MIQEANHEDEGEVDDAAFEQILIDNAANRKTTSTFAQDLRAQTAAVRLMHSKLGNRKALSPAQMQAVGATFGADDGYLSASKKLIDSHDEAYKTVTGVISRARAYWQTMTVPFPVKGIRLLRRDLIPHFEAAMLRFREELTEGVQSLSGRYQSLCEDARDRLGDLFNERDYPDSITDCFDIRWDYPSVEPPNHLKELAPELYEREAAKISSRFESALQMAEEAFAAELKSLVSHLVERLTDDENSDKPKVFKNSAVTNLSEFFTRFQTMNIRSNGELNQLVEQAQGIINEVDPSELRKQTGTRVSVAQQMEEVKAKLDQMVIDAPIRWIELED